MRYDEDAVESICQHTKLNRSVHLLPDKGGIYIKTSFPQLEALLLAYIILAGPCLGETSATGMTNESSFNLETGQRAYGISEINELHLAQRHHPRGWHAQG